MKKIILSAAAGIATTSSLSSTSLAATNIPAASNLGSTQIQRASHFQKGSHDETIEISFDWTAASSSSSILGKTSQPENRWGAVE